MKNEEVKEDRILLEPQDPMQYHESQLPFEYRPELHAYPLLTVNDATMQSNRMFIASTTDDFSDYEWLQLRIYSENHSGAVIGFFVECEGVSYQNLCGYMLYINVSWTGWKTVTFSLKKGFATRGTPIGFHKVTGYRFLLPHDVPPEKTILHLQKVWLTNYPTPDDCAMPDAQQLSEQQYIVPGTKKTTHNAVARLKSLHPNQAHPRLILTTEKVVALQKMIHSVPFVAEAYWRLMQTADKMLEEPILPHARPDGRRLSRMPCEHILHLSLAFLLSRLEKYKKRLWEELESVCSYPDWNASHDIDVGDYARPVAFAYDWLYSEWTGSQRRLMRNAMMYNAVLPMITHLRKQNGFAANRANHNVVTASGLGLIGLAIGDEAGYEDIANELIHGTVQCIPNCLTDFAPYGVCVEGIGYWNYGQGNLYVYQASLWSALGTDYGLKELKGQSTTGDYVVAMNSPIGRTFNYSDAKDGTGYFASLLWPAQLYDRYDYAQHYMRSSAVPQNSGLWDLIYFKEGMQDPAHLKNSPKDYFFETVGSMRSDTSDPNAWYVGFKGGNRADHMDLDFGSFVLDVGGKRWIVELGCEAYDMPGMWMYTLTAGRWKYYRKRAEGNNTLVIDPEYDPECIADQYPFADTKIVASASRSDEAFATVDLSSAYPNHANTVLRTYALKKNRSVFELKDSIDLKKESEIYAFFHTEAEIRVSEDRKSLQLIQGDQKMHVQLLTDAPLELRAMAAEPLLPEFQREPHASNSKFRKFAVHGKSLRYATYILTFQLES